MEIIINELFENINKQSSNFFCFVNFLRFLDDFHQQVEGNRFKNENMSKCYFSIKLTRRYQELLILLSRLIEIFSGRLLTVDLLFLH